MLGLTKNNLIKLFEIFEKEQMKNMQLYKEPNAILQNDHIMFCHIGWSFYNN